MPGLTVAFQSANRRGLGHLMRALNLAREVADLRPDARILVVSRNRSAPAFCAPYVECVVAESDDAGGWHAVLRRQAPDVVVYDTLLPADPDAEPVPDRARVVYVLRQCRPERHARVLANPFLARCDAVVVPHAPAEFGYVLPPDLAARTLFSGPIARHPDPHRREELRRRYDLRPSDALLVSTAGGGGFAHSAEPFFASVGAVQRALEAGPPGRRVRHVVVLGPNYRGPAVHLPDAVVVQVEPALVDLLALADLVLCEGGYNTVTELRLVGTPALILPGARSFDDQEARARELERRGMAEVMVEAAPDDVAAAVCRLLGAPRSLAAMRARAAAFPLVTGNRPAAEHLLGPALLGRAA